MGELTDKITGNAKEGIGKIKQQSANPETRADGRAQETEGKGDQLKGTIKGVFGDDI